MADKTVGQMLDQQLASLQDQITELTNAFEAHIDDGETPPVEPPVEPPVDPPVDGEMIDRPYGVEYLPPPFDVPYNPNKDVPADALRWSNGGYASLGAICKAARDAGKAAFIDVAQTLSGDLRTIAMPSGLYGVPGVVIKFTGSVGSATPCLGYVVDRDFECRGIRFETFGTVFGFCTRSYIRPGQMELEWDLHGSSRSLYGTQRVIPKGADQFNGVGIEADPSKYPTVIGTAGPKVNISDCEFINCEVAFNAWSDTVYIPVLHFHRNKATGTYGLVALETTILGEIYACGNTWADCTGSREMKLKGNRYHTAFKFGIDTGLDVNFNAQTIQIENNFGKNISDSFFSDGTNTSVFADLRQITPAKQTGTDPLTMTSSVSVSFNELVNLIGTQGQEDANAIYAKARGIQIERNLIDGCGAPYLNSTRDGCEASGIEIKDCFDPTGVPTDMAIIVRGNIIRNAPPKAHPGKGLTVIGTNDVQRPVYLIGNRLENCHITYAEPNTTNGLIRLYGKTREVLAIDNEFDNCHVVAGGLIATHNWSTAAAKGASEFSNNEAYNGPNVDYAADALLICSTGGATPSSAVTGHNWLCGSSDDYKMKVSGDGTGTATEKPYKPPQIPTPVVQRGAPSGE